ncbi:HEAT repeat family [Cryptosporidium sp. chipmunk genotype I]|uniref:HEAT repeat family n=1 Tax=Cryptosporidium sp. chipmunk genotype I TaxID=1280935 RepID=UPI00351A992A|nr:HEAT repeat family [Cryptosporidium sp. chipmunk genotype I]
MIDVKCRKHVDLKAILDFYKLELESDNKSYINEALRRYSLVSKVVGKDHSEYYLLPLILKVLEIGSYEVNHIVSEELVNIIDPSTQYTEDSKRIIKDICNYLLFNEELSIRMESIKSLEIIFSRLQEESSILSFIEEILLPIIKTKLNYSGNHYTSTSSSLTDKLSLCNIIPSLMLPYCDKLEKNNLLLLYLSFCDDEVPSLRIGASQKLVQILKNIFPLKCGMSELEYQQLKLSDQNIITEKLLNLVLTLYKDQTCDTLKSASIGIAIQLYTNPIFYIEFISCDDRDSLLHFICSIFENRTYLQRQAVIEELIPLCLSLKGYYELSQEDDGNIKFSGYISNNNCNILSNIKAVHYSVDMVQFVFDNLSKEVDVEIRLLTFKFIERLLKMGIDIFESNKGQNSGQTIEYQRKSAIDEVAISIIMYINKNISELLTIGSIQFKCIFCIILVQMIIYSQRLFEYESSNQKIRGLDNNLEHLKIKNTFIQVFISNFNDPNINVVSTAIENLHKIIYLVSEEQLCDFILPKIKSVLFVDVDLIAYNNKRVEKSTSLHKWRIIRCIIRQIPLWIRYNQPCVRICPFYNSIIVRSILDTAFSVSISALQTIMRIVSKFNNFNECTTWINEFIIPSIILPFIENKTHSIKYTFDMVNYINYSNIDNFNPNKNIEVYEYKFESCDYMNRIFIINLIFAIYRSLFYKWVYVNFQGFKDYLNSVTSNISTYFKENVTYIEEQNNPPVGVLSDILDGEELFIKFSKLVVPVIKKSLDDPIKNVSIAASQLVVQVIKIFSLDLYFTYDKEMFACSSFGERDGLSTNNDADELLKEHLLNQFEFDSVWHLRNIMSNNKIDHKNVYLFPNCIYQELISVFERVDELEIIESDLESVSPIISIKEWYNAYKKNLLSSGKQLVI